MSIHGRCAPAELWGRFVPQAGPEGAQAMKIAVNTPIVMLTPGRFSDWEAEAGAADLLEIARAADALDYDYLTCPEHIAVPIGAMSPMLGQERGTRYWDPAVTLAFLAAHTTRVRLATSVLVLGYHHPLQIAKQFGTLDLVSGGRVVLGVGVGTVASEFAMLGADFADRGRIADDMMLALRASLSRPSPSYSGPHFAFADMVVDPHAVQPQVPLWVGGQSARALRRAVERGDGWMPGPIAPEIIAARLQKHPDRPDDFVVAVRPTEALDPCADAEGVTATLRACARAGATVVEAWVRHDSLAHYLDQLHAFARLANAL